jgi:hypothetical protein
MRPDAFRELLRQTPFRPFRVYISDGATYDVAHPEAARVSGMTLIVDVKPSGFASPTGERTVSISLIHITRVEVYYPGAAPSP